MSTHKKVPSWGKLQGWFVEKLMDHQGGISPLNNNTLLNSELPKDRPLQKQDYQAFLEAASRTMIRFKKPEHLIKMIVRTIDEQLKIMHTAVLLHKAEIGSYILIDSKGTSGLKIPVGFVRLNGDNPLINIFTEKDSFFISETGILNYDDIICGLRNRNTLELQPDLYDKLLSIKKQMDLLKAVLCVPCYFKRDLLGILLLGEKINGEKFSREEMGFFVTLANDAAMAIANAQLIESLQQRVGEIKELYVKEHRIFMNTALALAAAIDARDPYTYGHTERVTGYCLAVAKELLGVPEVLGYKNFMETLTIAASLHDVGKVGIPDYILSKNGRLTPEEFEEIKKHSIIGATILGPIKELSDVAKEVRHHQECYDGSGYPDGLAGNDIPLISRIISVTDAFDAMTSNRPYRKKRAPAEALKELKSKSGTQFDPIVVSAFLLAYQKGNVLTDQESPVLQGS